MPFRYPVALELKGRRCVVIGGGEVAEQKVRALIDAEAAVAVVSEQFTDGLESLGREGLIELVRKGYSPGDLEGAFLAIGAPEERSLNAEVYREAEERNVLFNAVDDVPHCHFAAPSIVRRGDFMLTISTGGKAPALAKKLRKELSEQFGTEYGELVDLLGEVREKTLPRRRVDFDTWAQRWGRAVAEDLIGLVREGRIDEAKQRVAGLIGDPPAPAATAGSDQDAGRTRYLEDPATSGDAPAGTIRGRVWIVGAGPGDPGLITVRGREALEVADVVVSDRLANPELVKGKKVIYVGKEPGSPGFTQDEINGLLVRLACEGRNVVRLKGGDPFVFGRGGEEAEALGRAGVEFEIVPGATSAIAALAAAGIPITDRRFASSAAIVTGHCSGDESGYPEPDLERLAGAVDTMVILMGMSNLDDIVKKVIAGGRPPDCPAAIIENGTLSDQRVVEASLEDLPSAAQAAGIKSPAVIVIGEVVRLRAAINQ